MKSRSLSIGYNLLSSEFQIKAIVAIPYNMIYSLPLLPQAQGKVFFSVIKNWKTVENG